MDYTYNGLKWLNHKESTLKKNYTYIGRGVFRGGRLGARPLDFQNLKRKSTVTHHSNRKRDKEEEIYCFWSYDGQRTPPPPLSS
jgi:hypothetical protein